MHRIMPDHGGRAMVSGASVAGSSSAGDPALARERRRSALSRSRCVPYPKQPHEPRPGRQSENQQHDHAREAEDGDMPRRPPHRRLQGLAPAERERRRNERHEEGPPRSDHDHHGDERQQAGEHLLVVSDDFIRKEPTQLEIGLGSVGNARYYRTDLSTEVRPSGELLTWADRRVYRSPRARALPRPPLTAPYRHG